MCFGTGNQCSCLHNQVIITLDKVDFVPDVFWYWEPVELSSQSGHYYIELLIRMTLYLMCFDIGNLRSCLHVHVVTGALLYA
jgi:hypothetical protein